MKTNDQKLPRQYPHIMAGKTILYVHGFGSSAKSGTVKRMADTFPQANVVAYDLPLHPAEAMELLHRVCNEQKPNLIIGTSMGGMYTEMLHGYDRILVNPAFEMGQTMHDHGMMGQQTYQNERADGVQTFMVNKALIKEFKEITEQCFAQVTPEEQSRVWGLFGDADPVVHTFDVFNAHYPQALYFHGEHRLDDSAFFHGVLPVIRWIDDKQERRERPIVYVHESTLKDSYGGARASLVKAFEMLLNHYEVYIVAQNPLYTPDYQTQMLQWLQQYLGTAAWGHVVFTQAPRCLYGDYFIANRKVEGFMGTSLVLGSDELKTWDDAMVFFERLGGQ